MADRDVVEAARALKTAHIRAQALGGEHQPAVADAFEKLMDAVGDVEEPEEVAAYRAEVVAMQRPEEAAPATNVEVTATQEQAATLQAEGQVQS